MMNRHGEGQKITRKIADLYARLDDMDELPMKTKFALVRANDAYVCGDEDCLTFSYGYNAEACRKCGKDEWRASPSEMDESLAEWIESYTIPLLPLPAHRGKKIAKENNMTEWQLDRRYETPIMYADNSACYVLKQVYLNANGDTIFDDSDVVLLGRDMREVRNTINALSDIIGKIALAAKQQGGEEE